jgi:ABC-2 type transport system permease protein
MKKLLYVARFEFVRHIKRRGFIWAVVGIPGILVLVMGGVILFLTAGGDEPIGVVDRSGLLANPDSYTSIDEDDMPIFAYDDEEAARQALASEAIQAFFIVPDDYLENGAVTVYHEGSPNEDIYGSFNRYARTSLLKETDSAVAARFTEDPLDVNFVSLSEDENAGNPIGFILPFIFGFMFVMGIFTTGGYLLQAVVDEKENRTMEIMATSIKPEHMMIGKILGLVALGLVQLTIWISGAVAIIIFLKSQIPELAALTFPAETAVIALLWFVPFYLLIASIWAAIGLMVTEVSEGQQALGIISILTMSPLWLVALFLQNPNSPLAIVFSLIPFTSPLSILIRRGGGAIPLWQLILSWIILILSAFIGVFAVSRLLRIGMLRYGKRVTLREFARQLRS